LVQSRRKFEVPQESTPQQISGETLSRITSSIVGLYREHFGRGPTAAKTYALDDVVVCVLRDGLTVIEKTLFNGGKADTVRTMRAAFQDAVSHRFTGAIEELTGRKVRAFLSQAHVDPDLAIEVFFLDRPLVPLAVSAEMMSDAEAFGTTRDPAVTEQNAATEQSQ
jgi:uncharacterized protein YbcI